MLENQWVFPTWTVKLIQGYPCTFKLKRRDGVHEMTFKRYLNRASRGGDEVLLIVKGLDRIVLRRGDLSNEMIEILQSGTASDFLRLAERVRPIPALEREEPKTSDHSQEKDKADDSSSE